MVFNATFNSISVISWQTDLLVEETEVPTENHWSVTDKRKLKEMATGHDVYNNIRHQY